MSRTIYRVPLDFHHPLEEIWPGFLNPYLDESEQCLWCRGSDLSKMGGIFSEQWFGFDQDFDPVLYGSVLLTTDNQDIIDSVNKKIDRSGLEKWNRNGQWTREESIRNEVARMVGIYNGEWSCHLIQADVEAIVKSQDLSQFDLDQNPSPYDLFRLQLHNPLEVADWRWVCLKARCERNGSPYFCKHCEGEGESFPSPQIKKMSEDWSPQDPPKGEGYQVWETVSDGSPISPVFADPQKLAEWMSSNSEYSEGLSADYWLKFINVGYAPSGVMADGKWMSGVEFFATKDN